MKRLKKKKKRYFFGLIRFPIRSSSEHCGVLKFTLLINLSDGLIKVRRTRTSDMIAALVQY